MYTGSNTLSDDSQDWTSFATFFSGFLQPIFAIINILVLLVINIQIIELTKEQSQKSILDQKELNRINLLYQEYERFRVDFRITYNNMLNAPGSNQSFGCSNNECYNNFRVYFDEFLKVIVPLFPEILNSESYKFWENTFIEIDSHFEKNQYYDFSKKSYNMSLMRDKFLNEIVKNILPESNT